MKSADRHATTIGFFRPPSLSGEVSHFRAQFCPHVVYDVLIVHRRVEVKLPACPKPIGRSRLAEADWPKLIEW